MRRHTRWMALVGVAASLTMVAADVGAKARFMGRQELIQTADIIAVVDIVRTEPAEAKGKHWTYRQAASAVTERVVKGDLPDSFTIHAQKSFICAQASYDKGRYLVFLRKEGDLYTTVNHHLGQFAVARGDWVEWFTTDDSPWERGTTRLSDALETIER